MSIVSDPLVTRSFKLPGPKSDASKLSVASPSSVFDNDLWRLVFKCVLRPYPQINAFQAITTVNESVKRSRHVPFNYKTGPFDPLPYSRTRTYSLTPYIKVKSLLVESDGSGSGLKCADVAVMAGTLLPVSLSGWGSVVPGFAQPSNAVINSALQSCSSKLQRYKDIQTNYMTALAVEGKDTIRMIGAQRKGLLAIVDELAVKASLVAKAAQAVRKGDAKRLFALIRQGGKLDESRSAFTKKWRRKHGYTPEDLILMYRLGILPLMGDIESLVGDLARANTKGLDSVTVKGRGTETSEVSALVSGSSSCSSMTSLDAYSLTKRTCVIVNYSLSFKLNNRFFSNFAAAGITDPLGSAWQALPWSFIADWFLNISNYLDWSMATSGWDFLYGTKSIKSSYEVFANKSDVRLNYLNRGSIRATGDGELHARFQGDSFTRTILTQKPSMTIDFHQHFKFPIGRIQTAAALLRKATRGSRWDY